MKEESEERKREVARLEFDVNLIERESKRLESDLLKVKNIGCGDLNQSGREQAGVLKSRNTFQASPNKIYGTRGEVEAELLSNNSRGDVSDRVLSGFRGTPVVAHTSFKPFIQMDQTVLLANRNLANTDPAPKTAPDLPVPALQRLPPTSPTDPLVDSPPNPSTDDRASPPGSSRGSDKSVRFNEQENVLRFCSTASSASLSPPPLLLPVLSPRSILKCVKGGYGSDSGSDTGVSSLSSMQGDYELSTLV